MSSQRVKALAWSGEDPMHGRAQPPVKAQRSDLDVAAHSEAVFREFLSGIGFGALMLDTAGTVEFINDHLLGLLERTRAETLGMNWADVLSEGERDSVMQALHDV